MSTLPDDCRHYTGIMAYACKAGVNYRQHVGGQDSGWACRLPCRPNGGFTKPEQMVPCDKADRISAEEAQRLNAEDDAEVEAFLAHIKLTQPIIDELRAEYRRTRSGAQRTMDCPACGKQLTITVSAYNGHTSGCCETKGCLAWRE